MGSPAPRPENPRELGNTSPKACGENAAAVKPAGAGDDIAKVGRKSKAAVFLAATKEGEKGQIVKFSEQESAILKSFLRTQNFEETAKEVAIKPESVKRILRRPNLKAYLDELIRRAAIKEGTDLSWMVKELRLVWEGEKKADPAQMQAMKQLGDLMRPKGPGIAISVQQNSYYAGLGKEAIDAEWSDARTAAAD